MYRRREGPKGHGGEGPRLRRQALLPGGVACKVCVTAAGYEGLEVAVGLRLLMVRMCSKLGRVMMVMGVLVVLLLLVPRMMQLGRRPDAPAESCRR